MLYSVPDDALPSSIFSIHVGDGFARIRERTPVTRGGEQVLFDLEGIVVDTSIARPKKIEGLAVTRGGYLWVVLDNDGGEFESRLVRYNQLFR